MEPPRLAFAFTLHAEVGPPIDVGETPRGRRRMVPIVGGRFEGPGLRGRVLPGGADWQLVHGDGTSELDSRYVLEVEQGGLIGVRNRGLRRAAPDVMGRLLAGEPVDPALVYFVTTPTFETGAADLQWLTRSLFIGTGRRQPRTVEIEFWKIE